MKFTSDNTYISAGIKKYLAIFSALTLIVFMYSIYPASAEKNEKQNVFSDTRNYAVLISQPNHLNAAVNTAETITANSTYKRNSFVIMSCGKSVESFIKGSSQADVIEKGKTVGVTYKICGMSLKQLNINPDTIIGGIEIVPNGLTYMFDIQIEGYKTIEL